MCKPSIVADDWVKKGCHVHLDEIEVAVRPDHLGGIVFRRVFSSPSDDVMASAFGRAKDCLDDVEVRRRWHRDIERARGFMQGYTGVLARLANGRQFEFRMLLRALERIGV
jgi:hypothetical protein